MFAIEKFTIGQRVKLTPEGVTAGIAGKANRDTGVVKGFPDKPLDYMDVRLLIRVQRDGQRQSGIYHMDFWMPLPDPPGVSK